MHSSPIVCRLGSAHSLGSPAYSSDLDSPYLQEPRLQRRTTTHLKETASRWTWVAVAMVTFVTFWASAYVMYANQYGHIHDHIDTEYNLYVAVWQAGDLTEFYNTQWMLIVGDVHTVDLVRTHEFTKTTQTVLGTRVRRNMTTHVEFATSGVLPLVFYPAAERDFAESPDPAKWKRVQPEMLKPLNFRLRSVHEATAYHSWVTLEDYPLVRRAPEVKGLSAQQCEERQGLYVAGVCQFMEYLAEVCIRVAVDPESYNKHNYDVDYTHAGAGCYPEDGLRVPQYARLPAIKGERDFYLPRSVQNATRMVVRHAHDPELMEKVLKHELRKEVAAKRKRYFIGVAAALLSLALLLPSWLHALPVAVRSARKLHLRWRFPHALKDEDRWSPSCSMTV